MFLTDDELLALTDRKRPSDQIRYLRERGYPFEIGAKGKPKVLRSVVEQRHQIARPTPRLRPA
jgi:hypothetical protein